MFRPGKVDSVIHPRPVVKRHGIGRRLENIQRKELKGRNEWSLNPHLLIALWLADLGFNPRDLTSFVERTEFRRQSLEKMAPLGN